jgi:hypothetical protein
VWRHSSGPNGSPLQAERKAIVQSRMKDAGIRRRARQKLNALLSGKRAAARAWELQETFSCFWKYKSQPARTDEKGSSDAARPGTADFELVSGQRRNLQWRSGWHPAQEDAILLSPGQ